MSDPEYAHQFEGGCRCGGVSVTYCCHTAVAETPVRGCQCEYCAPQQHGFLSAPDAAVAVQVRHPAIIYAHRFGTYTADFCHCAVCNELVFVRADIDDKTYAAVSVQALRNGHEFAPAAAVDFDGESPQQRARRRSETWASNFSLTVADAG